MLLVLSKPVGFWSCCVEAIVMDIDGRPAQEQEQATWNRSALPCKIDAARGRLCVGFSAILGTVASSPNPKRNEPAGPAIEFSSYVATYRPVSDRS